MRLAVMSYLFDFKQPNIWQPGYEYELMADFRRLPPHCLVLSEMEKPQQAFVGQRLSPIFTSSLLA